MGDEELEEEAKQVTKELDSTQKKILESLTDGSLGQYAIGGNEKQWRDSLKGGKMVSNVSIKSSKRKADVNEEEPSKKKPRWASEDASPPLGKTKKKRTPKPKRRHPR